jgi:hypothetical protein
VGLMWRLFAPKPLKKARRAMHPSWVLEDAIVRSVRGNRRRRQAPQRRTPQRQAYVDVYSGKIHDAGTGRTWRCNHDHASEASAIRCADAMEDSISRHGWEQATGGFWTYG